MLKDNTQPSHSLFTLLPSDNRFRGIHCCSTRLQSSSNVVFVQLKCCFCWAVLKLSFLFVCFTFFKCELTRWFIIEWYRWLIQLLPKILQNKPCHCTHVIYQIDFTANPLSALLEMSKWSYSVTFGGLVQFTFRISSFCFGCFICDLKMSLFLTLLICYSCRGDTFFD